MTFGPLAMENAALFEPFGPDFGSEAAKTARESATLALAAAFFKR